MRVYILFQCLQYDCSEVVGVFGSVAAAKQHVPHVKWVREWADVGDPTRKRRLAEEEWADDMRVYSHWIEAWPVL